MSRIVLFCATRRGYLFLKKLIEISPDSEIYVFSFREEPWEPSFFDDIRGLITANGGQFFETKQLDSDKIVSLWEHTPIDIMLVVSWRYMIPATIYSMSRSGTYVFHDSLLPKHRGFSPTVWAICNGEKYTGVTLFKIAEEVDAGDIVDQITVPIGPEDTIADVMDQLTQAYLDLLVKNINGLANGSIKLRPQDHSRATYTCKRLPADNKINWSLSCESIYNLIRAVSLPYPGAYTYFSGRKLQVWIAERVANIHKYVGKIPGRICEVRPGEGSLVLAGDGALLLKKVQLEDGEIICASDLLNSLSHTLG